MSPNCNVSSLFGFQPSYGWPHAPHAPHHRPLMLSSFSMAGGHPPHEVCHSEQLTMLTNISERDGSSSFCFSCHVLEEVRALPHFVEGVFVSRLSASSSTGSPILPNFFFLHCGMSSSSYPSSPRTFAMPLKALYKTSVIRLCTTTFPSSPNNSLWEADLHSTNPYYSQLHFLKGLGWIPQVVRSLLLHRSLL